MSFLSGVPLALTVATINHVELLKALDDADTFKNGYISRSGKTVLHCGMPVYVYTVP
jgi:hypothetical protein